MHGRQVLDAVRLIALELESSEGRDGFGLCAEALTSAACDDLADEVMLLQAEHLMQREDLEGALSILKVKGFTASACACCTRAEAMQLHQGCSVS